MNTHLWSIYIEDNYVKSFRRNKNFHSSVTDGKEHSNDFTGEKVSLHHLSTLISVGTWGLFFNVLSPHLPQIKNHHVPAPSGEHV